MDKLPDGVGREMNDNELNMLRVTFELRAEVEQYKRALELAVVNGKLCGCCPLADSCGDDDNCVDQLSIYFLSQAKEADPNGHKAE